MVEVRTPRVLVVEDDAAISGVLREILSAEGYAVTVAVNGREGLHAAQAHAPDVVLLDMNMPVMNGWEFARAYRKAAAAPAPIVVMTASFDARRSAQEVGADAYLAKPFDLGDLLTTLDHFTARVQAHVQVPA